MTEQIDIRSINPDDRVQRHHTASLLTHLNQSDARVQATRANVTIWHETLAGKRFGTVLETAHGYYRDYNPKSPDRNALSIGLLGHLLREQQRVEVARGSARQIDPPRKGRKMPRHVLRRLQARGVLTDRRLEDYPQ